MKQGLSDVINPGFVSVSIISQLILEKNGTVHREKKGRDKIVTIVKNSSEDKNS